MDTYTISVYDDGNQSYEQYKNEWIILSRSHGKYSICNVAIPVIQINSISAWKMVKCN